MDWHRIVHADSGEEQVVASLDGIDLDAWTATAVSADDLELEFQRTEVFRRVKIKRDQLQEGSCATPHGPVDVTEKSRGFIMGRIMMGQIITGMGAPFEAVWTMADQTDVTLTLAQLVEVGVAAGSYVDACQRRKRVLDAQIAGATTLADLAAIDVEAGWPS